LPPSSFCLLLSAYGLTGVAVISMAHRYKSYAAETGTAYQYFFVGSRRVTRPEGQGAGSDYIFVVTADQKPPFILRVFVSQRALDAWRQAQGRNLDSIEMYAVAKMRLFRAFDEVESLRDGALSLLVDEGNIQDLLAPLGL
jgi:hypothetical protein